jgi:hypothetical protein
MIPTKEFDGFEVLLATSVTILLVKSVNRGSAVSLVNIARATA